MSCKKHGCSWIRSGWLEKIISGLNHKDGDEIVYRHLGIESSITGKSNVFLPTYEETGELIPLYELN